MEGGIDIAISGPESSGKTALAIGLASHYGTWYVPEFARSYLERFGPQYTESDLERIIEGQIRWWTWPSAPSGVLRFMDGDASILHVWQHLRFASESAILKNWVQQHPPRLTLLCAPDLPWTYDPLRENEHDREALFERYKAVLDQWGFPHQTVSGVGDARLASAIATIDELLRHPPQEKL